MGVALYRSLRFIPGLMQQPAPPCEQHRCRFFEQCKAELLACEVFRRYVNTGAVRRPVAGVVPQRAIYQAIYTRGG